MRISPLALPVVLVLMGAGASPAAACTPKTHKYGGATAQTFCGPATASVSMPGRHVSFSHGSCTRQRDFLAVNIGTVVLSKPNKKRPPYFGVTVGKTAFGGAPARHDGTYTKNVVISYVTGGSSYAVGRARLTLAGNRTRGSFTGRLLSGQKVAGSFHC